MDSRNAFLFSSLQSVFAQKILKENGLGLDNFDTLYLVKNGKIYKKSDAVIEIMKQLNGVWLIAYFLKVIPKPIRDIAYDLIAINRYFLGESSTCQIPDPDVINKFII